MCMTQSGKHKHVLRVICMKILGIAPGTEFSPWLGGIPQN